jgi:hypothetical protein
MFNLQSILKMAGIEVPPNVVAQLEVIIPQIPSRLNEFIQVVNFNLEQFHEKLRTLESQNQRLSEQIADLKENQNVNHRSVSTGRNSGREHVSECIE